MDFSKFSDRMEWISLSWRLTINKNSISPHCSGYWLKKERKKKITPPFISSIKCHFFFIFNKSDFSWNSAVVNSWSSASSLSPSWKLFSSNWHQCEYFSPFSFYQSKVIPHSLPVHESQVSFQVHFSMDWVIYIFNNKLFKLFITIVLILKKISREFSIDFYGQNTLK